MGAALLGWILLGLAAIWAIGATIAGLKARHRFAVRPVHPEDAKPMSGDTYNVHTHGPDSTAIGRVDNLNIGTQRRMLTETAKAGLRQSLSSDSAPEVTLSTAMGDGEAMALAPDLKQLLEQSGWTVKGVNQCVWTGPVEGVVLRFPGDTSSSPALLKLGEQLVQFGIQASGNTECNETAIWVGANV